MFNSDQPAASLLDLEIARIIARQVLLAEDPQVAQSLANQTLYP